MHQISEHSRLFAFIRGSMDNSCKSRPRIEMRRRNIHALKFRYGVPMELGTETGLSSRILTKIMATASTTHAPQTHIPNSSRQQCAQDFATLQNAVQAGDLAAARGAYATFWEDVVAQDGPGQLFLPNAQTGHDLQAVGISLNSGDMAGARRAFAMFQRDTLTPVQAPRFGFSPLTATESMF
jgi:hypothetical protein